MGPPKSETKDNHSKTKIKPKHLRLFIPRPNKQVFFSSHKSVHVARGEAEKDSKGKVLPKIPHYN